MIIAGLRVRLANRHLTRAFSMDPVTAALSGAWQQAVGRIQSQTTVDPSNPDPTAATAATAGTSNDNTPPPTQANGTGAVVNRLV
jgi:hypothetical protein